MHDPEVATRVVQYEMAFRMQASVPELIDVHGESQRTLELYGCRPGDGPFASNCLLAHGSPSAACVSSSFIIKTGIIMAG